jgi:hypothetical protein
MKDIQVADMTEATNLISCFSTGIIAIAFLAERPAHCEILSETATAQKFRRSDGRGTSWA